MIILLVRRPSLSGGELCHCSRSETDTPNPEAASNLGTTFICFHCHRLLSFGNCTKGYSFVENVSDEVIIHPAGSGCNFAVNLSFRLDFLDIHAND